MDLEGFENHVRSTVRGYLEQANYNENVSGSQLDAIIGSALMSGMALMSDWYDDLIMASISPDQMRNSIESVGSEYGYKESDWE